MVEPYYSDDHVTLHHGDALDVLAELDADSIESCVTDPPYLLGFMGRQWDTRAASDHLGWHGAWAAECLRVLKPGGYLLAFGGSRTWHRLACAIEDAGFEIRDSIAWLYGSGFPKSLDVSKAIDKRPGVVRHAEFASELKTARLAAGYTNSFDVSLAVTGRRTGAVANWEKYQFPEARWWPALRDLLGMDSKWDDIIAEVDRCVTGEYDSAFWSPSGDRRVVANGAVRRDMPETDAARQWQGWGTALKPAFEPIVVARKPLRGTVAANVLEYSTGALNIDACRVSTISEGPGSTPRSSVGGVRNSMAGHMDRIGYDGSAGRWPTNVVLDGDQADELDRQSGVLHSQNPATRRSRSKSVGATGFNTGESVEYADEGGASRFFPVFRYEAKAPTSERPTVNGVAHPTVKPLDLMRWLVRLVTPPGGVVLDPFAGSGTTAEACILEHLRCITVEREADYLPLIVARLSKPMAVGFNFEEPA